MPEQHIHFHFSGNSPVQRPKPKAPLYVAVNQNCLLPSESIRYSRDGLNWLNANSGGFTTNYGNYGNSGAGNGNGLAYYSSLWVAVGESSSPLSTIQYSRDGSTWSNANSTGFKNNYGYGVARGSTISGSSIWVVVGDDDILSSIKYSSDGINWSNSVSGGFLGGRGSSVAYGNGLWVTVGSGNSSTNSILYSGNGSNWSNIISGGFEGNYGNSVSYGSNLWVAVGAANSAVSSILYSTNGSNWSNAISGGFGTNFDNSGYDVAYGNGLWVAVGNGDSLGNSILYGDGSNWSNSIGVVTSPSHITYTQTAKLVNNRYKYTGLWIANDNTRVQYSSNGRNWTYKTNNNVTMVIKA